MNWKNGLVALAGAVGGGVLGHVAAVWLAHQGFYALVLPGAMLGWGGGALVKDKSVLRAALCGVAGLVLGLLTDWHIEPFIADDSLSYYLAHVGQLRAITWLMVGVGAALGAWLALGRAAVKPGAAPMPGPG